MMPEGSTFPFRKIKLDYIVCSHKTWKDNKFDILKNCLNKPKVIFIDNEDKKVVKYKQNKSSVGRKVMHLPSK
jgi:hypothetical protein